MNVNHFKTGITKLKNQLRGLTLQLVNANSAIPYRSLREFGNAILKEEAAGNTLSITRAWTAAGPVEVTTFEGLTALISTGTVTAVSFRSFYKPYDFTEYIQTEFKE